MKLGPDFLCIGAEKSGTTWLYDNIRHHPDIWLPPPPFKELHFFDDKTPSENLLHLGKFNHGGFLRRYSALVRHPNIETLRWLWRFNRHRNDSTYWYQSLFTADNKICGDITPLYCTMDDYGVKYARKVVGDKCKIILILRDPISQAWSSVKMLYRYRNIDIRNCTTSEILNELHIPVMTQKSDYSRMIKLWRNHFNDDMFKVLFFDDLVTDSETFLFDICQFIGVDTNEWRPPNIAKASNTDKAEIEIPEDLRIKLSTDFLPELEKLSDLIGGHATTWLNKAKDNIQ